MRRAPRQARPAAATCARSSRRPSWARRSSGTTSSSTGPPPRWSSTSSFFPDARPAGRHAAGVRDVRGRLRRPADRRHRVRPLRRPRRPQEGAGDHAAADGRARRSRSAACRPTATSASGAPILLVLLRFLQGIGLGGEWGGAVLMVVEHGDERRRGLYSSWPQVGVPARHTCCPPACSQCLAALLSDAAFESWGWRIPFLLSAVLVLVGLWVRLTIEESPAVPGARGAGRDRGRAAGHRRALLPPPGRDRRLRAARRRRRVLHVRALHPHLRHDGARRVPSPSR